MAICSGARVGAGARAPFERGIQRQVRVVSVQGSLEKSEPPALKIVPMGQQQVKSESLTDWRSVGREKH